MRNAHSLLVFSAALVSAATAAQEPDFSKVEIKITKVAGAVYMLEGAGGNIAASMGEDGVVIVDDQFAPLADNIRAALKSITDKPLRFIINTHHHFDHTGGNAALHEHATIIAHDNVRKRLASGTVIGNGASLKLDQPASQEDALPVITFQHDVKVHLNGEEISALHVPHAHTDGDSIVFFTKSNVVHMGDNFVTYGFPFVDLLGGGSVQGMIAGLQKAVEHLPADVRVIPGHGSLSTLDDVRAQIKLLQETLAAVDKEVRAGKSLEQLKQEKVLDPWKNKASAFVTTDIFIETLYNELTGNKSARLIPHN
jgi:cyclase